MCVSDRSPRRRGDELYDMSGNVKEWVVTDLTATTTMHDAALQFELRGGAYDIASFTVTDDDRARACSATPPTPAPATRRPPAFGRLPLLPARKLPPN